MAPASESIAGRGATNLAQKCICRCWKRSGDSKAPETLCRYYNAIVVKELSNSIGQVYATPEYAEYRIDKETCRRCGGNNIKTHHFTEWWHIQYSGGKDISVCRTCGLYLTA